MPPRDPDRARIAAVVRWELLKLGLVALLVVGLGVWWFLSSFYRNHCECLWQECYNIVLNMKTGGVCWR
jgi:hypothetical protein